MILPDFSKLKVLVIGDIMLDEYIYGDIERISPEAPIPIFKKSYVEYNLGGAGNVAVNLRKLGCEVYLLGGIDCYEGDIINLTQKNNIQTFFTYIKKKTTKTRYICNNQQVLRVDDEEINEYKSDIYGKLFSYFLLILAKNIDLVILSDYGKGILLNRFFNQKIIEFCNKGNIKVFVDPKGKDWDYKKVTCIVPNLSELKELLKDESLHDLDALSYNIIKKYGLEFFVLKRGKDGYSSFYLDDKDLICGVDSPAVAKEIYDVSGAGDTFISVLSTCYVSGLSIKDSCEIANKAAGIVVGKFGTKPIELDELVNSIIKSNNKEESLDSVENLVHYWKLKNEKICFTNGCFDLLHYGHIKMLEEAKKLGTKLIVGINSDSSIKKLKGSNRPIINEGQRLKILSRLDSVDLVVLFDANTPLELIERIRPDVLVKGGDYKVEEIVGYDFVKNYGGEVITIPLIEGISTSLILEQNKNR